MMAFQAKMSLLCLLAAVLLVLPQVFASRRSATSNRPRRQECKDDREVQSTCVKLVKELGLRVCYTDIEQLKAKLTRSCSATCHFCGERQRSCRTSKYGCCWDGHTPRADIYGIKGCPECKDHLKLCYRFRNFCAAKKSENREFIELHCPKTCRKCIEKRTVGIKGQKVTMNDWFTI